jgi:leucyl aminopeptidase
MIALKKSLKNTGGQHTVIVARTFSDIPKGMLSAEEIKYTRSRKDDKKRLIGINRLKYWVNIFFVDDKKTGGLRLEDCRLKGDSVAKKINALKSEHLCIIAPSALKSEALAFSEGMVLGSYQFIGLKSDKDDLAHTLKRINIVCPAVTEKDLRMLEIVCEAVYQCRDLINAPVNKLNAEELSEVFVRFGKKAGISVEVLNKARIEALKMGGLLGVNRGSPDPPTFTIMEYKSKSAVNKKPFILVGKGVTFDTGGISLKPSASMTDMKCDMSGAAAVGSAIYAIAKAELPVWVIALIPATDNRPGGNAQVPGDVITMFDGTSVEVLNTDAEGRLILADALAYAKKYKPALVIDIATLTGAAHAAIGKYGIVAMHAKGNNEFKRLQECGDRIHERVVEFPFWDDYSELIKSEIADLKNIGGPVAGAITAGKFLEHFTDYPYIHLDIAGPAYSDKKDAYRGFGGSGVGVRLFFEFFKGLKK